ncbi:beta strand repeat-containing protein [Lactococcus sp.]|uniref:beta strand repeat-containing protein n=1 Tax=Lactococcus sp. TaxID=44273 RepID=UPI0035B1AF8E
MNQNNRKKWKYGIFIFVLLLLPLLGLVSPFFQNQSQAETLLSGNFGGVSYVLDGTTGQLTISPNTSSSNYTAGVIPTNSTDSPTYYPWAYNNNVKSIVFTTGTTYTTQANADYLFANMPSLTSISTNNSLNMVSTPYAYHLFDGDTALAATQAAKTSGTTSTCAAVAAQAATTTAPAIDAVLASTGVSWSVSGGTMTLGAGTLPTNTNDDPTFWPWYDNSAVTKIVVGGAAAGGTVSTSNSLQGNLSIGYLYANLPNLTSIQSTNGANDYFNGILTGSTTTSETMNDVDNIMINDTNLNLNPVVGTTGSTTYTSAMASISNGVITLNAVAQANNVTEDPTFYPWYGDSNITSFTTTGTWVASNGVVNAKGGTAGGSGTTVSWTTDASFMFANLPNLNVFNKWITLDLLTGPADESFLLANDQKFTGNPGLNSSSLANVNDYFASGNSTAATIVGGNGMMYMQFNVINNGAKNMTIALNGMMQNDALITSFYSATNSTPSGHGCVLDMNSMFQGDSSLVAVNLGGGFLLATGATYNTIVAGATNLMSFVGVAGTNTDFLDVINNAITANGGTNNNGTGSTTITSTVEVSGTKGAIYTGQTFTPGSNLLMAQDANGVTYKWPSASLLVAYSTTSTGTFSTFEPGGSSASTLASILPSSLFNTTTGIAKATGTFYVEYQLSVGGSVVATSTAQPVTITANQASLLATASTSIYTGSTEAAAFTPLSLVTTATDYAGTSIDDSSHVSYTITNSSSVAVSTATMLATPGTYTINYSLADTTGNPIVSSTGAVLTASAQVIIKNDPTLTYANSQNASVVLQKGATYTPPTFAYTGYNGETTGLNVVLTATSGPTASLDTSTTGVYYLTYSLEDASGNLLYNSAGNAVNLIQTVTIDASTIQTISSSSIGDADTSFDPLSLVSATDVSGNAVASSAISYTYNLVGSSSLSGTQSDFATNYATWLGSSGTQSGTMTFTYSYTDTATSKVLTATATVTVLKDGTLFETNNSTTDNTLGPATASTWNPLVLISKITDTTGKTVYSTTVGSGTVPPTSLSSNITDTISDAKGNPVANVATMLNQSGTYKITYTYKDTASNTLIATSNVQVQEGLFLNTAPSFNLSAASTTITGTPITVNGTANGNLTIVNSPATSNGWSLDAALSSFTGTDSSNTVWTLSGTTLSFNIANSQTVTNGPTVITSNGTSKSSLAGDGTSSTLISAPGSTGIGTSTFTVSSPSLLISGSDLYNIVPGVNYHATITWTISDSATVVN